MNSFGSIFRVTTWGESHGPAVGCVIDGCPSSLRLTADDVQRQLERRRPGQSDLTTQRDEADSVEILSGVFEDMTLGTPISMLIRNRDADPSKYREFISKPRPGHADLAWRMKFGHVDWRGGGRSSARETAARVAAGAVAGKLLQGFNVEVFAYAKQVGGIASTDTLDAPMKGIRDLIDSNKVRALSLQTAAKMEAQVREAAHGGDSVGGVIECVAFNLPAGLGEPVFGKLTADIAGALMSIPGAKGVEFGLGFESASRRGSQVNDEFVVEGGQVRTRTNNGGGLQGGMTSGMPVIARVAFRPTASIKQRQRTVDLKTGKNAYIQIEGRHDPCIIPRAVPVVEAMMNLTLADHMMLSGRIPRRLK
jgi:chorismate synthase